MKIKVLLAEDHELTRQGIKYGLEQFGNIEIVGEASNGLDAVKLAKDKNPDVVLMDIIMPVMNGVKATREIKSFNSEIKIIMLTSVNDKEKVLDSFHSKANAYCMKNIKIEDLISVIKYVLTGAIWIDPAIANFILEVMQLKDSSLEGIEGKPSVDFNLTNREKEILKLISDGKTNKDISEQLFLSLYTVKHHVSNIIQKLAVDDRTQAAIIAIKENIV